MPRQIRNACIVVSIDIDDLTDDQILDRMDDISTAIRRIEGVDSTTNDYDMEAGHDFNTSS